MLNTVQDIFCKHAYICNNYISFVNDIRRFCRKTSLPSFCRSGLQLIVCFSPGVSLKLVKFSTQAHDQAYIFVRSCIATQFQGVEAL